MAIDEALLNLTLQPTLRFYSWIRPTLSLGYFQNADSELVNRCRDRGVDIVRRPTGGRAVLHQYEVTYSISAPYEELPFSPTLKGISEALAKWQVKSLIGIGIKASLAGGKMKEINYVRRDSCFLTHTPNEIITHGRKICGSAQKRRDEAFLQHGSLLFDLGRGLHSYIMGENEKETKRFTTLHNEGFEGTPDELIEVMCETFENLFSCRLHRGELAAEEEEEVRRLKPQCSFFLKA